MTRRIPLDSPAVTHGVGLFETMLVARGRVPFVDAHYARLASTAARLHLCAPRRDAFDRVVAKQLRAVTTSEAAMRVMWLAEGTAHEDERGWRLDASSGPIPAFTLRRRKRGRAITLPRDVARSLPFAKSTSWLTVILALRDTIAAGADEGFFVDARGRILEGTSTNVFAIRGDRLITAPIEAGVLPGVVRGWVLAHAPQVGWKVVERTPTAGDILAGAFMTSSLTRLAPVRSLDGATCEALVDERFAELKRRFDRAVRSHAS